MQGACTRRGCIRVDLPPGPEDRGQPGGLGRAPQSVLKCSFRIQHRETDIEHAGEVGAVSRRRQGSDLREPLLDTRPCPIADQGIESRIAGEVILDQGEIGQRRRAVFETGARGNSRR